MQNTSELYSSSPLPINDWSKPRDAYASRVNHSVVCKMDRHTLWLITVEPVTMWCHMRSRACVWVPVSSSIRDKTTNGICCIPSSPATSLLVPTLATSARHG